MADGDSFLYRLLDMSEQRFGVTVADIISSDRFLKSLERFMASGASARDSLEQAFARAMQLFNVPTLDDLARLESKLEELEELIAGVGSELDALEQALERRPKTSRRRSGARKRSADETGDATP